MVWFLEGAPELSETAADLIESMDSRSLISSITSWELAVKTGLGRLRLPYNLGEEFDATVESMGFEILPLTKAALTTAIHSTGFSLQKPWNRVPHLSVPTRSSIHTE